MIGTAAPWETAPIEPTLVVCSAAGEAASRGGGAASTAGPAGENGFASWGAGAAATAPPFTPPTAVVNAEYVERVELAGAAASAKTAGRDVVPRAGGAFVGAVGCGFASGGSKIKVEAPAVGFAAILRAAAALVAAPADSTPAGVVETGRAVPVKVEAGIGLAAAAGSITIETDSVGSKTTRIAAGSPAALEAA